MSLKKAIITITLTALGSLLLAVTPLESSGADKAQGALGESADPIEAAVRRELQSRYPGARIEITGEIRWTRSPNEGADASRAHLITTTPQGFAQISLHGGEGWIAYRAMMPTYVAVRRLLPNEKLATEMFSLQEVNVASGPAYDYRGVILPSKQRIDGLEARQTVLEGQFLTSTAVQKVPDIRRGDAVRILLTSGDLTVSTQGFASEPAFLNGRVRVMASKSKREFVGELKEGGTVEVRL